MPVSGLLMSAVSLVGLSVPRKFSGGAGHHATYLFSASTPEGRCEKLRGHSIMWMMTIGERLLVYLLIVPHSSAGTSGSFSLAPVDTFLGGFIIPQFDVRVTVGLLCVVAGRYHMDSIRPLGSVATLGTGG